MSASDGVDKRQYLSFSLAGADFAVGILQVKELLQCEEITPIPSVPPSVRGVINLRGNVVPVVDLAVRFGQAQTAITRRTCILVVETVLDGASAVMGVMADTVSEVLELGPADIEPPPPLGARVRADYLLGLGKVDRGFVLLLDLDRVLSAAEHELVAQLPDALAAAEASAGAGQPEAALS
jgi:purine-binding chemotaxis protein CheW